MADSYVESSELNSSSVMAWFKKPENRQWKGNKQAKKQEDFIQMDALWTKITGMRINYCKCAVKIKGMKIQKRENIPPLREVINSI